MDLECPYCEKELDVNHDDGFGYDENMKHRMVCDYCRKRFIFQTSISYYYEAERADCLNDGKHDYKLSKTYPKEFSTMVCTMCDKERDLTDEERLRFGIGSKESYLGTLK